MRPSPQELCRQLAREVASNTTRSFVEASSSTPGSLYATTLPKLAHRLATAASFTLLPSPGPADGGPLARHIVEVRAHAPTDELALAILSDIRWALWPDGEEVAAPDARCIIGAPPLADGASAGAWRFVGLIVTGEPEVISRGSGASAAPSGQAEARMQFEAMAHPVTLTAAATVSLDVYAEYSDSSVVLTTASARLESTIIDGEPATAIIVADGTVAELVSAIDALDDWTATLHSTDAGALPAADALLLESSDHASLAGGVQLRTFVEA